MLVFRFYREDDATHFAEKKYKLPSAVPPVPRYGERVSVAGEVYMVVEPPTHYFERTHEVGFIVKPVELVEEEEAPVPVTAPATPGAKVSRVPLNAQGNCAYCEGSECPGGEDCDWYDGTLG